MATESFGAQLLTLPQIFKNRFFTIPDYQRGYAWEEKQVEDLLKDIEHMMNDGLDLLHYTGTLVLSQPGASKPKEFHVVDGQQRLTTIVIFMCCLYAHLPIDEKKAFSILYLRRGAIGNERAVLRLNKDTSSFFERVILGDGNTVTEPVSLEAHVRLLGAQMLIKKWLAERKLLRIEIADIRSAVESRLGFLVYAPKEDAETGIMFEVINNRGKPLSELEKVKNYLIYCCVKLSATTLRNKIDADWSNILEDLNTAGKTSPAEEGAFLRYCVAVHLMASKKDSQYGYAELKKTIVIDAAMKSPKAKKTAIKDIEVFVKFLKDAALWYKRLYGQEHKGLDVNLVPLLNNLRAQGQHASIMPIFLALVIKLKGAGDRLARLLKLLEVLNFRVYMARNMTPRNDTGQAELYGFASHYFHEQLLSDWPHDDRRIGKHLVASEEDALEYELVAFILWYAADERFKASFVLETDSPNDFYDWGGLRYFLMNYEAKLQPHKSIPIDRILRSRKEGKSADYLSVEHLWATENRSGKGENNRKVDKFEKRRLGNFVLLELRLNSQGSNNDLKDKLLCYLPKNNGEPPTDLVHVRKMANDAKELLKLDNTGKRKKDYYLDLHRELNSKQEARYVDFAEKRWSMKEFIGYHQIIDAAIVVPEDEDEA